MKEIWKPIEGFEGLYSVSNRGRVRREAGTPRTIKTRFLKCGLSPLGYPRVALYRNNHGTFKLVHNLVADAFIRRDARKPWINHKNGRKHDNRASNLERCTHAENMAHAARTRLMRRGERHGMAKLTDKEARKILRLRGTDTQQAVAEKFGVSQATVCLMWSRKTWKHI